MWTVVGGVALVLGSVLLAHGIETGDGGIRAPNAPELLGLVAIITGVDLVVTPVIESVLRPVGLGLLAVVGLKLGIAYIVYRFLQESSLSERISSATSI